MRGSLTKLRKLYGSRPEQEEFTWWHDVGSRVAKLVPKSDRHYGENVIEVALRNILVMSRRWLGNHDVWFGEPGCFSGGIKRRDRETILEDAESAIDELEKMHEAITDGLEQLTSFAQELKEQSQT